MTPLDRLEILARRLAEARRRSGLSIAAAAARISRGRSTLQEWESGRTNPTAVDVAALADLYNCSADWLLGRSVSSAFAALFDPRCERRLLETEDPKEFLARIGALSCLIHEDALVLTDHMELARRLSRVLERGEELRRRTSDKPSS